MRLVVVAIERGYERVIGYTDAKLSPTAKINVEDAQRRKANKVMCGP